MNKKKSIILSAILGSSAVAGAAIGAMAFIPSNVESVASNETLSLDSTSSSSDSVFADTVQDGQILQCFCWSYNEIMEYLPKIASQGFTAIQTSPVQVCKEATTGDKTAKGSWWAYYQPAAFTIDDTGDNALGTPEEFEAMCDMAHSYGVKVLVDVVANHLGNQWVADSLCERSYYYEWEIAGMPCSYEDGGYIPYTGEVWAYGGGTTTPGGTNASTTPVIDTYYYADTLKFHPYSIQDNDEAGNVTQGNIGMMDLDTSDDVVQDAVADYLEELIGYGVDGFRFDAAKHIETQYDTISSDFWPTVMARAEAAAATAGRDLYAYGEILNRPGIGRSLGWYTANGVAITDSGMGHNIVENGGSGFSSFNYADDNDYGYYRENMVTWAESHDNYMGTQDTHNKGVDVINKSYAILASRKDFATLYCARFEDYENSILGDVACLNGWSYDEVGAVNKFHNFYAKADAAENCYMDNGYTVTERYTDSWSTNNGIVIVGNSGSASVSTSHLADGTYTDQVSGNTFTVSNGKVYGTIGASGIAVVYNAVASTAPTIKASVSSGTIYTDTLNVTFTFTNATASQVYVDSSKVASTATSATVSVTDIEEGTTVNIVVTVYGTDGSTITKTYSYTRQASLGTVKLYFNNSNNWSNVYAYAWNNSTLASNSSWPGVKLSETAKDSDGNTCYVYDFDLDQYDHVIFNNGSDQTVDIEVTGSVEYTLSSMSDDAYTVATSTFTAYVEPDDPVEEEVITVYFKNDNNWSTVYAYMWNSTSLTNAATWPGTQITSCGTDSDGYTAYSVDVDLASYDRIIFNNGSGSQTDDLALTSETTGFTVNGSAYTFTAYVEPDDPVDPDDPVEETITVYFKNDNNWSTVYAYMWNSNTLNNAATWPGTQITSCGTDSDGYTAYSVDVDLTAYDMIIFNNGSGSQTDDLALTSETTGFTVNGSAYTFTAYAIPFSTEITVYFKNTANWSNVYVYLWSNETGVNIGWPGYEISACGTDGNYTVYSVTVDYTVYDHIIFNNGSGSQTADLVLASTTTGYTANGSSYTYSA